MPTRSIVRGFARHWSAIDPRTEVPPGRFANPASPTLPLHERGDSTPDGSGQSTSACRWPTRLGIYHRLFGLLAATGLRISELIALERRDVDLQEGMLTVRGTKFDKSR